MYLKSINLQSSRNISFFPSQMQNETVIMLNISLVSGLIQRLYIRFGPYVMPSVYLRFTCQQPLGTWWRYCKAIIPAVKGHRVTW